LNDERLRQAFDNFDRDGSGQITAEELKALLGYEGNDAKTEAAIKDIFLKVDKSGDGKISFDEFKAMMTS
jgi:Ca2+-binding EF-hand superfamily protein